MSLTSYRLLVFSAVIQIIKTIHLCIPLSYNEKQCAGAGNTLHMKEELKYSIRVKLLLVS